jgi:hypothetical protein
MAYQVNKFNGTLVATVEDGVIDTTTDLRFIGKNYAGYGEVQNENFLHLMENFSNTTAPPKAVIGQIWYDSANSKLKFYNGSKFKTANGAEVSTVAPSGLAVGEFWWDSSAKQLYTYSGTDFVLVGPVASPDLGTSSVSAVVVKDTLNNNHTILKMIASGEVVALVNNDDAFTLNATSKPPELANFTDGAVKKGITLRATNSAGVSSNYVYWGTASNAARLGGVEASQFLQKDAPEPFSNEIFFSDNGLTIGNGSDLRAWIKNGDEITLESQQGNEIYVRITVTENTDERDVAVFSQTGIAPGQDGAYTLGKVGARWSNIYSQAFTGALTGNVTGNVTGNTIGNLVATDATVMVNGTTKEIGYAGATLRGTLYGSVSGDVTGQSGDSLKLSGKTASISITAGSAEIPIRDTSGNIYANQFKGIADKADQLLVGASYRSTSLEADANTVVARTSSGDIKANIMYGTATSAYYADLAEKYLADKEYEPGTVVSICKHGDHEIEACSQGQRALGVVSTNPAYMMNSGLEGGTYIALKGRVPVKVHGPVTKGDFLMAANTGVAIAIKVNHVDTFAIALETNEDSMGIHTIEAVVL